MAHIGKPRGKDGRIPVQIRKKGHAPINRTFTKRSDATLWARDIELGIERGSTIDHNEVKATLVRDLLVRFRDEVTPSRKGWKWEHNRLEAYLTETWSYLSLAQDIAAAMRMWRDERLKSVTAATVNRDFNLLGSVFTHAMKEWGVGITNPIHQVKRPQVTNGERDVTWTDADLQEVLDSYSFDLGTAPVECLDYVPWVLLLLRQTGLRLGSLCSIKRNQIYLEIPMIAFDEDQVKNGEDWKCPLGGRAVKTLRALMAHRGDLRPGELLIPCKPNSIGTYYRERRGVLEAVNPERRKGLRIHDLRHTWTTELVSSGKIRNEVELLKVTGRKDLKSLAVYFNPDVADMSKMLD